MATATFSDNPNYYIDVDASLQSQSVSGNYSVIYYRVKVVKTYGDGFWASQNMGNSGWADSNVGGNPDLWNDGDLAYDFRTGSNTGSWTFKEGTFRVYHDSDGRASYYVNAGMTLYAIGSARAGTGTRSLPSFVRSTVPPAPNPWYINAVGMTSFRFAFNSAGDGGSPIIEWQIGYGTGSGSPTSFLKSWGTSIITGLSPGTTYYIWARGRNANGWGPWSSRSTTRTIAGARVRYGGVWREAIPYVRINGVWKIAQPMVKSGGTWKNTG